MADSPKFTISEPSILISPPNDFVPEKEKDREWFLRYTRWVVANFYNAPAPNLTPNQTGTPIVGFAQQAMVSWSYALQKQHNYQQYYTTDFSGAELPVPFIPGGEIKQIVKHMGGVLLGAIENIEITATNLSEGVASKRAELYEKAMLKYEVGQIAEQILPPGVTFDPINDPDADLSSKEDIEKFVTSWQDEYSIIAEKIGDSQMWADELKKKFLKDGVNQYVSGLSCIHTTVESGYVCNHVVPDYETIFDNRDDDPFKENSLVCGQVKHNMPYQEVVRKYEKWLSKEEIIEIRNLAIAGYANVNEFTGFYNVGLGCGNQFYWWSGVGTSSMTVSVATVYFIAPRDWRYRNYRRTGETVKIEDDQMYSVKMQDVPGADIPGDYSGWDVHQATLIGNKYLVNFGYMPNTLRKRNKKGRPLLPMRILMADTALGQNTSMVQSLIPLQNDLDMLEWKIKEKVANDFGSNYIFNGNKFDGEPAIDIINNLKRMHVHVAAGSSGEPDDPQNAQRMVEPVDMTLDANIIRYVELSQYKNDKMNAYASVSEISLGQQPGTVGKGVQEKTILQNSKGIATINWSIMKHFQDVVQYNVNMKQMLYQFRDSVEETLVIGDKGNFLLKLLDPKEFGTQNLQVFLEIDSPIDPQMRQELRTIALSEAQNGKLDTVDFVEHILGAKTAKQAVKGLKYSRNKRDQEIKEQGQQAATSQMQHEADIQYQKDASEAAKIQLEQDNENWRIMFKEMNENIRQLRELMTQPPSEGAPPPPPISPLQVVNAQAGQPASAPVPQSV